MTKKELAATYHSFLSQEGYRPDYDTEDDIFFKKEGLTFLIVIDPEDEKFVSVILPNIWKIESPEERSRTLIACDESNKIAKLSKVHTVGENVWVTADVFMAHLEDFKSIFDRILAALQNGTDIFAEAMKEKAPRTEKA